MDSQLFQTAVSGVSLVYNDLKVRFITIDYEAKTLRSVTPVHVHDYYEFYMLLKGRQYTTVQNHEFISSGQQFFLVPPNVEHGHRHFLNESDDGILVRFSLEQLSAPADCPRIAGRIIRALSAPHALAIHDDETIQALLDIPPQITTEQLHMRMLSWLMRLGAVYESDLRVEPRRPGTPIATDDIVQRVLITMYTMFMTDLSVNYIAKFHNISYRHLSRIFLQTTGYTLVQCLTCIRLRNALRLLQTTNLPIREIARRSGFRSEAYFTNVFSRFVGAPPSAMRAADPPVTPTIIANFEARMISLNVHLNGNQLNIAPPRLFRPLTFHSTLNCAPFAQQNAAAYYPRPFSSSHPPPAHVLSEHAKRLSQCVRDRRVSMGSHFLSRHHRLKARPSRR